jgi:hypothetical protein
LFEETAGGDPDFVGGGDSFTSLVEDGLGFVGGLECERSE